MKTSYIICGTPRSGTTLLSEALWLTGVAGRPTEYFQAWASRKGDQATSRTEDLQRLLVAGTTPNGVFGAKIMWRQFRAAIDGLKEITGKPHASAAELFGATFPGLRYLRTVRRDKVRQAVSLAKAVQSHSWADLRSLSDEPSKHQWIHELAEMSSFFAGRIANAVDTSPTPVVLRYDFEQLSGFLKTIREHEQAWNTYFAEEGMTPHTVIYEDLVADYDGIVFATLDYLEIERPERGDLRPRIMRRQSDALNDEWTARLTADLAAAKG